MAKAPWSPTGLGRDPKTGRRIPDPAWLERSRQPGGANDPEMYDGNKPKPRPPIPPAKKDNSRGGPDEGHLGKDAEARQRDGMIDAENARKDAEWEKRQLDKDVKESPSVHDFLGRMKDKADQQRRERERLNKSGDELRGKARPKPAPPYNKPPLPQLPSHEAGGLPPRNNSKKIETPPPGRLPIPKRPNGTPPQKRLPIPPTKQLPDTRKPNRTPPFKGAGAPVLRFMTTKPKR